MSDLYKAIIDKVIDTKIIREELLDPVKNFNTLYMNLKTDEIIKGDSIENSNKNSVDRAYIFKVQEGSTVSLFCSDFDKNIISVKLAAGDLFGNIHFSKKYNFVIMDAFTIDLPVEMDYVCVDYKGKTYFKQRFIFIGQLKFVENFKKTLIDNIKIAAPF